MEIINTAKPSFKPRVTMLIYGNGGVGKTSAGATAPNPILLDFEGGSKYFGLRGIGIDVAMISEWDDVRKAYSIIKASNYETVIIDPIGEAMEKLLNFMIAKNQTKLVQPDGQPTMAGWGYLKDNMRRFIKSFRDLDKHLVLIAHVEEKEDDGVLKKRPMIRTKLAQELINLVDVVVYMEVVKDTEGNLKRVLRCQPNSDKFEAKDRTGQLGEIIEPNVQKIVDAIQGNEKFAWMKKAEKNDDQFETSLDESRGELDPDNAMGDDLDSHRDGQDPMSSSAPVTNRFPKTTDPVIAGDTTPLEEPPVNHNANMDDLTEWESPHLQELRDVATFALPDANPLIQGSVLKEINKKFGTTYKSPKEITKAKAGVMIGGMKNSKPKTEKGE